VVDETGQGEESEYVPCPVCQGQGQACKYCEGHGDVHPDDVDLIQKTWQKEKGEKTRNLAVVAVGVLVAVGLLMLVLLGGGGASPDAAYETMPVEEAMQEMSALWEKGDTESCKKLLRIGRIAIKKTQKPEEQMRILRMNEDAKEKLSLKGK